MRTWTIFAKQEKEAKTTKKKVTKADIGPPCNFHHLHDGGIPEGQKKDSNNSNNNASTVLHCELPRRKRRAPPPPTTAPWCAPAPAPSRASAPNGSRTTALPPAGWRSLRARLPPPPPPPAKTKVCHVCDAYDAVTCAYFRLLCSIAIMLIMTLLCIFEKNV